MINLTVKALRKMSHNTMVHGLRAKYHVSGDWLCYTAWASPVTRDEAIRWMLAHRDRWSNAPRCLRWSCDRLD